MRVISIWWCRRINKRQLLLCLWRWCTMLLLDWRSCDTHLILDLKLYRWLVWSDTETGRARLRLLRRYYWIVIFLQLRLLIPVFCWWRWRRINGLATHDDFTDHEGDVLALLSRDVSLLKPTACWTDGFSSVTINELAILANSHDWFLCWTVNL